MKESINLMPPQAIASRRKRVLNGRLARIYNSLVVLLLLIGVGYGVAYGLLFYELQSVGEQAGGEQNESGEVFEQTKQTNTFVQSVHQHFILYPAWIPLVSEVMSEAPTGVAFESVRVSEEDEEIVISGTSPSRDATLAFEQRLEALDWIETVDAPLENFTTGSQIQFTFALKRKSL